MTTQSSMLRVFGFVLGFLCAQSNAQALDASPTLIGPQLIGETFVGYDESRLHENFGAPTFVSADARSKTHKYLWTKVIDSDGKVIFDGPGAPNEAPADDSASIIQCRHEFDIHASGLVTDWLTAGACHDPSNHLDQRGKNELNMLSATNPAVRYDSPDSFNRIAMNLSFHFVSDELNEYHEYFEKLTNTESPFVNGRSPLEGIQDHMRSTFIAHNSWKRYLDRIKNWKKQKPESVGIGLLESFYWEAYAWHARGTGMSGSVSETGFKLFRQRIKKALAAVKEIEQFGRKNPLWHASQLSLMLYANVDKETILKSSEEAAHLFPNYLSIRFATINALSPRWGGSFQLIDKYIDSQLQNPPEEGPEALYARLYWSASSYVRPPSSVFTATSADWQKMRAGFEKLETLYPISFWVKQNFAAFSCKAKDKTTYLRLRPKFEDFVHPQAWRAPYNLDTCDFELLTET